MLLIIIVTPDCRFRCCSFAAATISLSSIVDASDDVAADQSTAVVADAIQNYDESIDPPPIVDAADQFFAAAAAVSNPKRIGVSPLLKTKSATRLQHCNNDSIGYFSICPKSSFYGKDHHFDIVKLVGSICNEIIFNSILRRNSTGSCRVL